MLSQFLARNRNKKSLDLTERKLVNETTANSQQCCPSFLLLHSLDLTERKWIYKTTMNPQQHCLSFLLVHSSDLTGKKWINKTETNPHQYCPVCYQSTAQIWQEKTNKKQKTKKYNNKKQQNNNNNSESTAMLSQFLTSPQLRSNRQKMNK